MLPDLSDVHAAKRTSRPSSPRFRPKHADPVIPDFDLPEKSEGRALPVIPDFDLPIRIKKKRTYS